jgi:predicted HTH domain antitoxin
MNIKHKSVSRDFPADILLALNTNEAELKKNIKISFAIRFYVQAELTIGKAAQLAGLSRYQFEKLLSQNQIPISNLDMDEILNDSEKIL